MMYISAPCTLHEMSICQVLLGCDTLIGGAPKKIIIIKLKNSRNISSNLPSSAYYVKLTFLPLLHMHILPFPRNMKEMPVVFKPVHSGQFEHLIALLWDYYKV